MASVLMVGNRPVRGRLGLHPKLERGLATARLRRRTRRARCDGESLDDWPSAGLRSELTCARYACAMDAQR